MQSGGLRTKGITKTSTPEKTLITVVTVVYNGATTLEQTIQSVVNQTYDNVEYIIIDGASTDASLDIIKKYEDKIDYWQSEPDKGIYDAMNKGCNNALGNYCIYLNCGDYFLTKDVLQKSSIYITGEDIITGKEVLSNHTVVSGIQKNNLNLFSYMNSYLPHESTFIKTNFLKQHNYRIDYRIISDYVFFYEALFSYNVTYKTIPIKITFFNLDGISSKNRELANKELENFFESALSKAVLDLYYKYGGNKGCLELCNYKFLLLGFKICRKIRRILKEKLNYYL